MNNFGPANNDETIVFGASRPGYSSKQVDAAAVQRWIAEMKKARIRRVVCLLRYDQLSFYDSIPGGLLGQYREAFGNEHVLSVEVEDYHLIDEGRLDSVIEFLKASDSAESKVVVHCSGGSGRTGHVLAAWLVRGRGHDVHDAISIVNDTRNPREAINCGNATDAELIALLEGRKAVSRQQLSESE